MKTIFVNIAVLICVFILTACHQQKVYHDNKSTEQQSKQLEVQNNQQKLNQLVQLMSGQFDSLIQSQQNPSYFNISLKMKEIWPNSGDGKWLYVEQAVGDMLDQPYRQRVYHVTILNNGDFSSAVYELPDAKAVIGAYENPSLLSGLKPEDLTLRQGCAVILKLKPNNTYQGSTVEKNCLSQLRGASYATSLVVIDQAHVTSWDRGYDVNDQQVWGAEAGPYVFDRK